jgi:hypothetical protein
MEERVGWGNVSLVDHVVDMLTVVLVWLCGDTVLSRQHGGRAGVQRTAALAVSQG